MKVNAVILAAGKGTRMNSDIPKCAHAIIDKPMVEYVCDNVMAAGVQNIITIVGYKKEIIEKILNGKSKFAIQEEQLGTAHAVLTAEPYLKEETGLTLIATGDMPFISKNVYEGIIGHHIQHNANLTILTTVHPEPYGYGRIIRNEQDRITGIVEEKDCNKYQRTIQEINASVYVVDNKKLFSTIRNIRRHNEQNEYYLTDIVEIFNAKGYKVIGYKISDYFQISGINDQMQLSEIEEIFRQKIIRRHLMNGVTIHTPHSVIIGQDVKIDNGAVIYPGTIITGKSVICANAEVGPGTHIENSIIRENCKVLCSFVKESVIEEGRYIGPCNKYISATIK